MLYEALKEQGRTVQMYKLEGAYHGLGGFHSEEAIQLTLDFIVKHL